MCYCFVLFLLYAVCYESGLILISVCGKSPHPPHSIRNSSSVICGTEMTVNSGASGLLRCTVWLLFQCYDVEHEHLAPNPSSIFVNFRSQERRTLHYTSAGRQVGAFETKRMKHRSFLPLPTVTFVCVEFAQEQVALKYFHNETERERKWEHCFLQRWFLLGHGFRPEAICLSLHSAGVRASNTC